ncbi:MAG: hypothetical protein M1839_001640 [Geoglossum umbratile]|nr:MAG: hypothetical protein M1839_001640 [Geoglossum umbratile]
MSAWRKEYLQGLEDRDEREKANLEIFTSCKLGWTITWTVLLMGRQDTKLATRTSVLSTLPRGHTPLGPDLEPSGSGRGRPIIAVHEGVLAEASPGTVAALRLDLTEAQRSKSQLQTQLKAISDELRMLRDKSDREGRVLTQLSTERAALATRIRDRDEELKGKSKLLEDVQDEMLALNIQLNMADERYRKLEKENKDLVDRWMARMGKEADAMNDASKFS